MSAPEWKYTEEQPRLPTGSYQVQVFGCTKGGPFSRMSAFAYKIDGVRPLIDARASIDPNSTHYRATVAACVRAAEAVGQGSRLTFFTNLEAVTIGITKLSTEWIENNATAAKDLWMRLLRIREERRLSFTAQYAADLAGYENLKIRAYDAIAHLRTSA